MKKMSKTVVFFGSGPVAEASLRFIAAHFEIEAVVTKPVTEKAMASACSGKPTHTVNTKQELTALMATRRFQSQLGIIVDFGIIVEKPVIDYFKLGIVNSHFSLLPEWRGADPITFAILSGQPKTGVSLMLIVEKLDEGDLIAQEELAIAAGATTPSLTQQLVKLSGSMLVKYIPRYVAGGLKPYPQPHPEQATYSRKLTKEDGTINWGKPALQIEREIRAFTGWPKSRTTLAGKEVIITKAKVVDAPPGKPGTVRVDGKRLLVRCGKQALLIEQLKPVGKNEMSGEAFIAGHRSLLV